MAFGIVRKDKAQIDVEINGEPVKKNLADMGKAYRKLNREIRELNENDPRFKQKAKEMGILRNEINKTKAAMNQFSGAQGVIGKGFGIIGKAAKAAIATFLPLLAITELFNFSKEIFETAKETEKLNKQLNQLTGATGADLAELSIEVKALEKTFEDVDIAKTLDAARGAANAFRLEGESLGETYKKTFLNIELGLLAVVEGKGDEFLSQVAEYSVQLEELGLNQSQAFALIAEGINKGVFNDKAPDAIKELKISLESLTKAQKEVLTTNFGKEFTEQIVSGEKTSLEALSEISAGLNKMQEAGKNITPVISELFKGAGEDAGKKFILSLQSMDIELNDLIDTSNVYVRNQLTLLESNKAVAVSEENLAFQLRGSGTALEVFWNAIKFSVINSIADILEYFRYLPERWEIFMTQFKEGINSIIAPIEKFINAIKRFSIFSELPDVKIGKIDIDESSVEKQKALLEKLKKDREDYAKSQELKRMVDALPEAEANRKQEEEAEKRRRRALREQGEKEAEEKAKKIREAERKILRLQIDLMDEGTEKQIALAEFNTNEKISALKGSADQIRIQTALLEEQLATQISKIRSKAAQADIKQLRKNAADKIAALVGTEKFVAEQIKKINQDLVKGIEATLGEDQTEQEEILKISTEKRIESLSGSEEFVKTETIRLRKELTEELKALEYQTGETLTIQKKEIAETELSEKEKALKKQVDLAKQAKEKEELLAIKGALKAGEAGEDPRVVEQNLKDDLIDIEIAFLEKKLELNKLFGEDTTAIEKEIAEKKIAFAKAKNEEEVEDLKEIEDQKQKIRAAAANAVQEVINFRANQIQNGLDQELNALDQQKEKELAKVGDNEKARTQIEERFRIKKEEAEKEAAKKQKEVAITQTIINTAQSIVKTGASLGYPAAIPFQFLAGGIGLAELNKIRKSGFADGGFTGLGMPGIGKDKSGHRPVGIAHEGEWYSPKWMTESPKYRPYINFLENSRLRGFADGGFTSTVPSAEAIAIPGQSQSNDIFIEEVRGLKSALSQMQFVMPVDQKLADLVQDETSELNSRRNKTLLG